MKRLALLIAAFVLVASLSTQASAHPRFRRFYRPRIYRPFPRVVVRPPIRPLYVRPYYRPYYPRYIPGPYPYYGPRISVGIGY